MSRDYIRGGVQGLGVPGPPWLERDVAERPAIAGDLTVDAIVVGAGIVGALVAHELTSRGLHVALIERRRIAGGTTGHSTAKITVLHDVSWSTRMRRRGPNPRLAEWAALNAATPALIGDMAASLGIECGYRRLDAHLVAATAAAEPAVAREMDVLRRLGIAAVDLGRDSGAPLGGTRCIRVAEQAQFDPSAFALGLIDSMSPDLLTVAETSPVRKLVREGAVWCAHLDSATVRAPCAVMTALAPVHDPALLFAKLYPYAAYAMEFVPRTPPPGLTLRPRDAASDSWIVAGQHLRLASQADERAVYARLLRQTEAWFPGCRPVRYWSTHDLWTPDWLPFVGRVGPKGGLYMIAGFGGWGMSASLPAARLVADAITGMPNTGLLRFLSPNRLPGLRALPSFAREGAIVARRLLLLSEAQRHAADVPGVTAVTPGSKTPRCTHLRCRLKVDPAEGTLNCPCHGSRFTGSGSNLYGPAKRVLTAPRPDSASRPRAEA
jgi:glycine/D-amino acid oxidase-like deaminating enzyme